MNDNKGQRGWGMGEKCLGIESKSKSSVTILSIVPCAALFADPSAPPAKPFNQNSQHKQTKIIKLEIISFHGQGVPTMSLKSPVPWFEDLISIVAIVEVNGKNEVRKR